MMSICSRYVLLIIFISHMDITKTEYYVEGTQVNVKDTTEKQNTMNIPFRNGIDLNDLPRNITDALQTPWIYIKSFPVMNSDCFCSYDQLNNLLRCSSSLKNSVSLPLSSINLSLINITLNDCTFSNNLFNLPQLQGKNIDRLCLNDINHQDYLVFDPSSFASYSINYISINYTVVQPITMLLLSNDTFSSPFLTQSLRTLYIDSCYLVTLNQPFTRLLALESIVMINIHQFSWHDFQQQIVRLPNLRSIYLGERIISTTNDIFNVLSCQDFSSQWKLSYRLIQTCSCQLMTFLQTVTRLGNIFQCKNSNNTLDFIDDICHFHGKDYLIRNQTNLFCNQCLSKQCGNGTVCAESNSSDSTCLPLLRYDYATIRSRIPFTPYTKKYLLQESQDNAIFYGNKTLKPIVFNTVPTILVNSAPNQTANSASDVQKFHQTFANILSQPWSIQTLIYAPVFSVRPNYWNNLILSLDQSLRSINDSEPKFEFQSNPISTVSLLFPPGQQPPESFGWAITNNNTITTNITESQSSDSDVSARVFLEFKNSRMSPSNCGSSNKTTNCNNRFSITSLKSPKLFCQTNGTPEYDVISIIAPNSNQRVTFYFDQKLPLTDRLPFTKNTTNSTKSHSFYDQLDLMIFEGVCMYLNTTNMTWQTDGCVTNRQLSNGTSVACTCEHLTMFTVFFSLTCATPSKGLQIFSWIGCGLSILGLSITLIMFVIMSKCRRTRYTNNAISSSQSNSTQELRRKPTIKSGRLSMVKSMLFVLCLLLILMNIFIFILTFIKPGRNLSCTILSATLYYFTLTGFLWQFFFGLQQSLFLTNILHSLWSNRTLFLSYLILTFTLPICPLLIMFIKFQNSTFISSTCNYCWLTREFLLYGLILPILVILVLNILFYFYTMIYLCRTNREQPGLRSTKSNQSRYMQNFKIGLFFAIVMGLSWILGFLVLIPNSYVQLFGNILFCIVNSMQGFAFSIMVFWMLERKAFRKCCCFWRYKSSMKIKTNSQEISPQQLETTSNDDNGMKVKTSYASSLPTSSTSNGENNNPEVLDRLSKKLSTKEEEEEEEEEHVYTTLPM